MVDNSKYVCPQCGPDSNGGDIHALTHHTWPPMTETEARKYHSKMLAAFLRINHEDKTTTNEETETENA